LAKDVLDRGYVAPERPVLIT
jgi:uncharacterized membrane protein (DUF2068 family)